MSRRIGLCVLVLGVWFGSSGCETLLHYPKDRLFDMADLVGVELLWGQGFLVNGRATKLAQLGIGAFDGDVFRYARRDIGFVEEIRAEAGLPLYYFTAYDRKPIAGNSAFVKESSSVKAPGTAKYNLTDPQDRGFYELGLTACAFLGVGVQVDFLQCLDFMMGWLCLDVARDDTRHRDIKKVENPRYKAIRETPVSGGSVAEI